ncbi:Gfo/Idh/MocA family protein [Polaribacter marinivivus]|uniref:Gfo/Idh/MocA family protein n=1 Tax=Polaribacter marinivivus TaxID=1524260 RepID=UPI003D33308F
MNKKVKWGILGCGKIAQKFALDLAKVENAELYAVASREQQKANDFANRYNFKFAYNAYNLLAKDKLVDAIYIATPHVFHKENTILCLKHKKAVLCEKPFAMNLGEVTEMITVAKENNVLLMEALWTYFLPHYQFLLEVFQSKKYGELLELKADFGFKPFKNQLNDRLFKKSLGGGSLLDIGIYPIFAALSTLGKPESINANATFFENGADSSCDISFNYKNAKAELHSTLLAETPTEAIFTFEKAKVTIHTRFHEPTTVSIVTANTTETKDFNYKTIGYSYEIEHFNQLLRNHKIESNLMTYEFSKTLIQTLDNVREKIGLTYS